MTGRPTDIGKIDKRAPVPKKQHIGVLLVMRVYQWCASRKDGGLALRAVDIEHAFNVSKHQSIKLRKSYLLSRGVFYGNQ